MDGRGFNKGNILSTISSVQVLPIFFKEIAKVGFPIYLTGIVSFISGQGDRVVTALLLGSFYLGIYQLVALAAVVPSVLILSFSSSLLPSSTYYYTKGKI
jgi:O-antigen/teichoic acid export membrane protein